MRTFKFRVFDKKQGNFLHTFHENVEIVFSDEKCYFLNGNILDDNYVIQQFTGLYDVNKKEVYEGDVVKFTPFGVESNTNYYLQLDNGIKKIAWGLDYGDYRIAGFVAISLNPTDLETRIELNIMMQPYMKVVGNIFEL